MKARLEVIVGPEEGKVFTLEEGRSVVVGRGAQCHLRIHDPRVSRTHFLIEKRPLAYRVFDMGSSGGTFVNGNRVAECDLAPGDVIRIGHSELRLAVGDYRQDATPEPLPSPEQMQAKSDRSVLETVGKRLAGFEIQAPVGAGRTGFVFRACDPRRNLIVALKILRPELCHDSDGVRRFVDVMNSARDLRHRNVVRVYTAGTAGGHGYVAMEYVDGESLAQMLWQAGTSEMVDWSHALRVGQEMARALQAAQPHRIVHGNITPKKILLRREDRAAKLADLVLRRALEGLPAGRMSAMSLPLEDLPYLAPERFSNDGRLDARSDIYSLGATLYALATGHPPFEGDSPALLAAEISQRDPDRPKDYQPAIPDPLENLILRMIAKRPDDRVQSPAELADAMDEIGRHVGLAS